MIKKDTVINEVCRQASISINKSLLEPNEYCNISWIELGLLTLLVVLIGSRMSLSSTHLLIFAQFNVQ
jgi:hypothetical protein